MNDPFVLAAHNTVFAVVLALCVYGVTRLWRNPPIAHLLWLLVLLKLVAPPIVRVDWPSHWLAGSSPPQSSVAAEVSQIQGRFVGSLRSSDDRPDGRTTASELAVGMNRHEIAANLHSFWHIGRPLLLGCWISGVCVYALIATTCVVRFNRCLPGTLPASQRLQQLASDTARKIGLRRVPEVRYVSGIEVPMLWCAGRRPIIVLPVGLLCQVDEQSVVLILAHELAHLRRRDHLVRFVELVVSAVYWWNPLVGLLRRQIHQSEELCCDAWVRWAFPDRAKSYARVLLQTAESLSPAQLGGCLLPGSPFLRSLSLKERIEMILENRFPPHVSTRTGCMMALLAMLILAPFLSLTHRVARASSADAAPSTSDGNSEASASSGFPYKVSFEQGATAFVNGDKITIHEVHGTASYFAPNHLYMIKGSYTLASLPRAMLAAYVTATDADGGKSVTYQFQRNIVNRGNGTFTLFLVMTGRGWPHVSFYPSEGGESFGGTYFGTGDSVLKAWWGTKKTDQRASAPGALSKQPTTSSAAQPDPDRASDYPYAVRFEQGATRFLEGDSITILEVRGTADTMRPENTYMIKGTYRLASHRRAMLAAYVTARDAANGVGVSHPLQSTVVGERDGDFTLFLPMSCRGWPHVSFYPSEGGGDFGGNYFGTGDSVLKRWWGSKDTD